MGSNRKQPFGYAMEFGQVVIHPVEAECVKQIFERYCLGTSFQELSNMMQESGIKYDVDKPWNKNMVARILGDKRYIGDSGFPAIITDDMFQRIADKRVMKAAPVQRSEAQKILRKKCECRPTEHVEAEVVYLLNCLIANPEIIQTPEKSIDPSHRKDILSDELEELLGQMPVNEVKAREKILDVAVAMYEEIDPREYKTYRMKNVFQKEETKSELDTVLFAISVAAVYIEGSGRVKIKLRNDQIIERGE